MTMNVPPTAHFTWVCNTTKGGRVCKFNGSSSRDDVAVTSWSWSFGDGKTGTGVGIAKTFLLARTYAVRLTVRDTGGMLAAMSCQVRTGSRGSC
jgi:PKD repeat protein